MEPKDMAMANEAKEPRAPNMIVPVLIGLCAAMLAGGIAGYNEAAAESGDAVLAPWVGPLVAIAFGVTAIALYIRRHAAFFGRWSPRKRLYWASLFGAGTLGMASAITLQAGGADLTSNAALSPTVAVALSALWVVGLAVSLVAYERTIDDHERQAYHLGGLWGFYAFIIPCPAWWVMHRAEMAPPVDAMILFIASLAVNAIVYFWFKFR
jgi:hypothetical protein